MRTVTWVVGVALAVSACMPGVEEEPGTPAFTAGPVVLSPQEVADAEAAAGCTELDADAAGDATAQHVDEEGPAAADLYDVRPPTHGDHLGAWVEARVYEEAPDERAVVHNHEHGAISVWYAPDAIAEDALDTLRAWAEARNDALANDAGAGVVVAPFDDGLEGGTVVALRAWTGGLDCDVFDPVVADGFLLERFGDAPEGGLAPDLAGVVDAATSA